MMKSYLNTIAALVLACAATVGCSAASPSPTGEATVNPVDSSSATAQALHQENRARGIQAMFAEADTNKDGKVTRDEMLAAATARFQAADTNHDGYLDATERKAMHAAMGKDAAHQGSFFAKMDHDGNGTISRDEAPPHLAARFDQLDTNFDGVLDKQELAAAHGDKAKHGAMAKMDADGDGKVSLAEFTAGALRMFSHLDTDNDGVITLAEAQAARPHRQAR